MWTGSVEVVVRVTIGTSARESLRVEDKPLEQERGTIVLPPTVRVIVTHHDQ